MDSQQQLIKPLCLGPTLHFQATKDMYEQYFNKTKQLPPQKVKNSARLQQFITKVHVQFQNKVHRRPAQKPKQDKNAFYNFLSTPLYKPDSQFNYRNPKKFIQFNQLANQAGEEYYFTYKKSKRIQQSKYCKIDSSQPNWLQETKKFSAKNHKGITCLYISTQVESYLLPKIINSKANPNLLLLCINALECEFCKYSCIDIAYNLKNFTQLRTLDLKVKQSQIDKQGYFELLKSILKLQSLEKLLLNFSCNKNLEVDGKEVENISQNLKRLKSLKYNFYGCESTPDFLQEFAQELQKVTYLEELDMNIYDIGVWDEEFEFLSQALSKLTDLTKFKLITPYNVIRNKGFQSFCQSLMKIKNLKDLNLDFSYNELTKGFTQYLKEAIDNLKSLSKIKLNFCVLDCTKEDENYFKQLVQEGYNIKYGSNYVEESDD